MDRIEFSKLISRLSSHDLSEEVLTWTYDYAIKFIGNCESSLLSNEDKKGATNLFDFVMGICATIPSLFQRIDCDNESIFSELLNRDDDAAANAIIDLEKLLLKARLTTLKLHCESFIQNHNQEEKRQEKTRDLDNAISTLQNNLDKCEADITNLLVESNTVQNTLSESKSALISSQDSLNRSQRELNTSADALTESTEALEEATKKLKNMEHDMLTHVLTLMGVFSAVITMVMSVIMTSTAWLNNADGASAILAFIIPSAVAVLSVIVLLLLVFLYQNSTTGSVDHPIKSRFTIISLVALLIICLILTGCLIYVARTYTQKCEPDHTHTILTQNDSTVGTETLPDGSTKYYFEFTLDGSNYKLDYDAVYIHNGNLYFCQEHKVLE